MFAVGPGRDGRHAALPAAAGEIFNGENDQRNGEEQAAELGQYAVHGVLSGEPY
jgi:hypothetical protein